MKLHDFASQPCSIARALAEVGDAWTMLIMKEAFLGKRRFGEFVDGTGAQRTVVSDRLKKLVLFGILDRVEYQEHPSRHEYRLTDKGRDLNDLMLVMARWGDRWLDDGSGPPLTYLHTECGHEAHVEVSCTSCGQTMNARTTSAIPGPGFPEHLLDTIEHTPRNDA